MLTSRIRSHGILSILLLLVLLTANGCLQKTPPASTLNPGVPPKLTVTKPEALQARTITPMLTRTPLPSVTPTVTATIAPYRSCNQSVKENATADEAAFVAEWNGYPQVYFTRDGEINRRPLHEGETSIIPVYSPDGSKLAYVSRPVGASTSLLSVLSLANGNKIFELAEPEPQGTGLSWSPDGFTIAFIGASGEDLDDLYTVDISTGKVTSLTKSQFGYPVSSPSYSASGGFIAFDFPSQSDGMTGSTFITDKGGLWQTPMPGDRIDALLPNTALVFDPKWSPVQDILLLTVWTWPYPIREFQIDQMFLYDRSLGQVRMITNTDTIKRAATWSPDGSKIAYVEEKDGRTGKTYNLKIINVIMDEMNGSPVIEDYQEKIQSVCWSASGQSLFFVADYGNNDGKGGLYNLDLCSYSIKTIAEDVESGIVGELACKP